MFQTKIEDKTKTRILCSIPPSLPENPAVYEIMWKSFVEPGQATEDDIVRRMRIACWITKATNTHSEYVTLIAVPLQQRLHEDASTSRYTCIAWLVFCGLWNCRQWTESRIYFEVRHPPLCINYNVESSERQS
jgi:hypothetical protein